MRRGNFDKELRVNPSLHLLGIYVPEPSPPAVHYGGTHRGSRIIGMSEIHPKLRNISLCNVPHSLISQNPRERMFLVFNLTPYCRISLPYITSITINGNRRRSQPTPLHCTMHQYVKCLLLFLLVFFLHMSLVELLMHGNVTLLEKAKREVDM